MRKGTRWAQVTDGFKVCTGCQAPKEFSNFHRMRTGRAGLQPRCKECVSGSRNPEAERRRGKRHYALHPERQIHHGLQRRHVAVMPLPTFVQWYLGQVRECVYCGIPESTAVMRYGHRLNVDRKDGLSGYIEGNVVLACQCCNLVKSGYLTYEEMLDIGQKYIVPKWRNQ